MKKTLKFFCLSAIALAAVSCYDDSGILEKLENLDERLTKVEAKLNTDVEAINSKIEGLDAAYKLADAGFAESIKNLTATLDALDGEVDGIVSTYTTDKATLLEAIAELQQADENLAKEDEKVLAALVSVGVTNVSKNAEGDVVITFVDGASVTIPTTPRESLVTVVEVDGVKYWAVIEDGVAKSLEVPVGHVDVKFQVNEDNCLLFSVDGGATWQETGAYVADDADSLIDFYQGETDEMDWETYEFIKEDFYTVVFGGETYYLPIYKVDNSVVTIKSGKTYFTYGESKTIDVAVVDVTSMYVMTKPDGWKAKLDGTKLTVTAPSEANVTAEVAEAEGEVLLHCSTKEGKCKVARLAVSTTEGFSLTVNADGTFTLVNPYATVQVDELYGDVFGEFNECVIGLATISSFEKDPVAYVNAITAAEDHWDDVAFYVSNWKMNTMNWETGEYTIGGAYEYGHYEVDVIKSTVADVYSFINYSNPPRGSQFVVWAAPVDAKNGAVITDELVFGYYAPMEVNMAVVGEPSFDEIDVELTIFGAEKFYVGHIAKEYCFNYNTEQYDLEEYLSSYIGYLQYGVNYIGKEFEAGVHEVTLSELVNEMEEVAPLTPGTEYFGFVLPIINGKAAADYSFDDVFAFEFATAHLTAGGEITAAFENEIQTYTALSVEIVADGAAMGYYKWYTSDEYNALSDVAADLLVDSYIFAGDYAFANKEVKPGDVYIVAAIAVDEAGQYGEVETITLTAPAITYSTDFTATVGEPVFVEYTQYNQTNYKVTIPVTVEGGEAAKYYYYWNTTPRTEEQLKQLPLGNKGYYYYLNSVTAPKDLVFYKDSVSYQFAVVVESTDGRLSSPVIITVNNPDAE